MISFQNAYLRDNNYNLKQKAKVIFFRYIKHTLDKYVEQDYVLVYFHFGLNSRNKPKLSWLLQAYREFDRK